MCLWVRAETALRTVKLQCGVGTKVTSTEGEEGEGAEKKEGTNEGGKPR